MIRAISRAAAMGTSSRELRDRKAEVDRLLRGNLHGMSIGRLSDLRDEQTYIRRELELRNCGPPDA